MKAENYMNIYKGADGQYYYHYRPFALGDEIIQERVSVDSAFNYCNKMNNLKKNGSGEDFKQARFHTSTRIDANRNNSHIRMLNDHMRNVNKKNLPETLK